MVVAHKGKSVDLVHLFRAKGRHWGILHYNFVPVALNNGSAAHRVVLGLLNFAGFCVKPLALFVGNPHKLKGGALLRPRNRSVVGGVYRVACTQNIGKRGNILTRRQSVGDLGDVLFPHAVHKQIRARFDKHRGAHPVVPVVVMGEAAQGGLKPAYTYGNIGEKAFKPFCIDRNRPVGACTRFPARGIGVVASPFFGGGVVGDH